jgi:glycosyltransferase involved in cell wall biosynthesis
MSTSSGADSEVIFLEGNGVQGDSATPPSGHIGAGLRLRRRLLRRAAFIVAQTPSAADELTQLINRQRVVVIPNPVRIVEAAPLAQQCRAVFTGRLSREKGLFTLLESWLAIVSVRPDAFLTIVGEGGRYQSVEQEVREIVADTEALRRSVRFTGWVPDVTPHLLDADVFILPSLWEGMSNSLLEACAHGRVVVASDIPANCSVLGDDYPLLFPPGDPAALANAVLRAFDDKARRSHATAVIATRIREFSLESVADRLEEVILRAEAESGLSRSRHLKEVLAKRIGRLNGPGTEPPETSTNTDGHDSEPGLPTAP